ncbi:2,3-diphosphoglycerate-dependent phosphoglycerate mutase [Litorimonas sp. RW-G-Af-16]|uniref:2,3-diphosphoglycerate-dependent phosphoglycerate mutase n=1 Tax=Litorimonas sp. RW-G-Af-16 TaxID=3241168 RepID=UPI00390C9800
MTYLVLVRHGQSEWNLANRFTGWVDVDLTPEGVKEAKKAGKLLAKENIQFDAAFTSYQRRAIRTLWMTLEGIEQFHIPVTKDWRLNERHYGGLTGLNKQETRDKHGDDQVHIWRRSFDVPPPQIDTDSEFHPSKEAKYAHIDPAELPTGESLKITCERVLPYYNDQIVPFLRAGNNLIISAHGNSLRALMKTLFDVSDDDIPGFEFPTGNPLLLELDDATLKVKSARYLDKKRAKDLPEIKGAQAAS